jgi:TonB family protein
MRRILVATLALTPMFLHAQANLPAQTTKPATTLQSKLVEPSGLGGTNSNVATATPLRISTGVIAPKLVHTVAVTADEDSLWARTGSDRKVVVSMVVDAAGKPEDVKVVESAGLVEDKYVVDAVNQFRFEPGTVSNQATAVPVRLEILLKGSQQ